VITTTRKFFSVVYSNFRFGHNFNQLQWVGAAIVMLCSSIELLNIDFDPVKWIYPDSNQTNKESSKKKVHKA
jgi:drug/metabolite transporter (DMT)-like permease